ncbi:MAG: UDP-N-acetylmuramoyl-tripeptide--D-alanyl-D-alanine ligase [Campylobacteraceae bacterium]|jgi:UDP-N-acetylmuramoyl-tripeptide--D-alanyl-D-alanine ligase|nr:UDP-N-acetylmuramoyl-tripeptide--D-alanyl-D-alanine ligase [Campylobacteraceae bacterium]
MSILDLQTTIHIFFIVLTFFIHAAFVFALGYYILSAMQWYSYRPLRAIFHYNKPLWHLFLFVLPLVLYFFIIYYDEVSVYYLFILYSLVVYVWHNKLDKPLQFTKRVKRFFLFLAICVSFADIILLIESEGVHSAEAPQSPSVIAPLFLALIAGFIYEKILFFVYRQEAKRKLKSMKDLRIIAITASYGKTSIKNFLHHILSAKFNCYKTPRSVNTIIGLIQDVNTTLPLNTQIYIAEAGARERGDIGEIAEFLEHDIAIIGQIGAQHIEYFKSLEAIRDTKMELIFSPKLTQAFVHESLNANPNGDERIKIFGHEIKNIEADLNGTKFSMKIGRKTVEFQTKLLGRFNAVNLAACIHTALYLGLKIEEIQKAVASINSVEHRLQRIDANGKIILDDSFNGNFEGMKSSYELVKTYEGRKVLITPGIVESTKEENEKLANIIDEVFDVVIITGSVNAQTLNQAILRAHKILLLDKSQLTAVLAQNTKGGDLILFSNDAPTYM